MAVEKMSRPIASARSRAMTPTLRRIAGVVHMKEPKNRPHWEEAKMSTLTKRAFVLGSAVAGAVVSMPSVLRAQATVLRWGEMLPTTHPQVQMVERIAKQVKEKTSGRVDIQSFPAGVTYGYREYLLTGRVR